MSVTSKFTGAVRLLEKKAREGNEKYRGNGEFQKLLNLQKRLANGVEAVESLQSGGEGVEEVLRYVEKFKNSLPGIQNELAMAGVKYDSSMMQAAYEHSGLVLDGYGAEIRSVFRSLSTADRFSSITKMLGEKNGRALSAILHDSVPAVLVGISPEMQIRYRNDFFKIVIPEFMETWEDYKELQVNAETTLGVARDAVKEYGDEKKLTSLGKVSEMYEAARGELDRPGIL